MRAREFISEADNPRIEPTLGEPDSDQKKFSVWRRGDAAPNVPEPTKPGPQRSSTGGVITPSDTGIVHTAGRTNPNLDVGPEKTSTGGMATPTTTGVRHTAAADNPNIAKPEVPTSPKSAAEPPAKTLGGQNIPTGFTYNPKDKNPWLDTQTGKKYKELPPEKSSGPKFDPSKSYSTGLTVQRPFSGDPNLTRSMPQPSGGGGSSVGNILRQINPFKLN